MSQLIDLSKRIVVNTLNVLGFVTEDLDGQEEMPGSSQEQQPAAIAAASGRPHYNIFKSKNNRTPAATSTNGRRVSHYDGPLLNTPRLTDPTRDQVCPKCKAPCHSIKCSCCGTFVNPERTSLVRDIPYKPLVRRSAISGKPSSSGAAVVDVDLSDDEEPIPAAASNGTAFPVTVTAVSPVSTREVTTRNQAVFLGSMSATAELTITAADFSLHSMSMRSPPGKQKININMPVEDCAVSYYLGPATSHLDRSITFFIRMTVKSARDLMNALKIPLPDYAIHRLDPKDPEEKYGFVAFRLPLTFEITNILPEFPARVEQWSRDRALPLFNSIKALSDHKSKMIAQIQDVRSVHKDRFDLIRDAERSAVSPLRTPPKSFYSRSTRKSPVIVPRKPEVIDLDTDESAVSAVIDGSSSPRPKRNRLSNGSSDDETVVAVYPPDSNHPVTIWRADLKCLKDGEYLNDNILDFYLNYILNNPGMIPEEVRKKTLLFNTFFFNKLTSKSKPGDVSSPDTGPEKHHKKVEKWLKHVNVFDYDFLIVPVNRAKHWFMLIVCYHSMVSDVVELDADVKKDPLAPCILLLDSLNAVRNGGRARLTDPLRSLLEIEWKNRNKAGEKKAFDFRLIPDRRIRVTEQDNYYDCGIYLLQYVEQFLKNPSEILASESNDFRDWVDRKVIAEKRNKIEDIICRLHNAQNNIGVKEEDDQQEVKVEEVKAEAVKVDDGTDELMDVIDSDVGQGVSQKTEPSTSIWIGELSD